MEPVSIDTADLLRGIQGLLDLRPAMGEIAQVLVRSVEKNFQQGGRYSIGPGGEPGGGDMKWTPVRTPPQTGAGARDAKGKFRKKGARSILQDTGALAASVDARVDGLSIVLSSNLAYAAIHHYGGVIRHPGGTPYVFGEGGKARFLRKDGNYPPGVRFTRPHPIPIPARPFLVVQQEDLENIVQVLADYVK